MRDSKQRSRGFDIYAERQSRNKSNDPRTPTVGSCDNNINSIFNADLVTNLKGVKAELRYQNTLANIAHTYHSSRELLMGSEVVNYWAVLHYSQRTLLDSYKLWRRLTRGPQSTPSHPCSRQFKKWRAVAVIMGVKISIQNRTEDRMRNSLEYSETNLAKAMARIRELEAQLKDAADNHALESQIDDLERQLRQARAEVAKLKDEIHTLRSEVEREKKNCARAEAKVREERNRADQLEADVTRERKDRLRAEKQEEVQRTRANDLQHQLDELKRQLKGLEGNDDELKDLRMRLRDETARASRAENLQERAERQEEVQRSRAQDLQRELDDLKRRLKQLEKDMANAGASNADLDALRKELAMSERDRANAEKNRDKALNQVEDREQEIKALRRELDELRRMLEKQLKQKDEKIGDQVDEIRALKRRIEELERRLRELEGKRAKSDDDTSRKALGKAINRWLQTQLTKALNKWRDEAAWKRRCEMALRRMALRWLKKRVYKAFTKLRDYAEAVRIKELEFQAYYTRTMTPKSTRSGRSRTDVL